MVKVVIGEHINGDYEWDAERRIVREVDGKRVCIGKIKGDVKVGDLT
ncbi:MAG: hypothetical protein J5604_00795 [Bacteroidales bacterium]|nr:hypothetical protein [Bacteroidales bacterium]